MRRFAALLAKDVRCDATFAVTTFVGLVVYYAVLAFSARAHPTLSTLLAAFPLAALPLFAPLATQLAFKREWDAGTSTLLYALPVPRPAVALSKLLLVWKETFVVGLLVTVGLYAVFRFGRGTGLGLSPPELLKLSLLAWAVVVPTSGFAAAAFALAKSVRTAGGLLWALVFFGGLVLVARTLAPLTRLLTPLAPKLAFVVEGKAVLLPSAPFVVWFAWGAAFTALALLFFSRTTEA